MNGGKENIYMYIYIERNNNNRNHTEKQTKACLCAFLFFFVAPGAILFFFSVDFVFFVSAKFRFGLWTSFALFSAIHLLCMYKCMSVSLCLCWMWLDVTNNEIKYVT